METCTTVPDADPGPSWKVGVIWMGGSLPGLLRLFLRYRSQIPLKAFPACLFDLCCGAFNSTLGLLQDLTLRARVARVALEDDPLFVIGHWRTGTTLIHELLALDPRHRCPTTYECFAPHHFLISYRWLRPLIRFVLPTNRFADNMRMDWDYPQEDEFALCNLGLPSPYWNLAFPDVEPPFPGAFTLDDLTVTERARWRRGLLTFLKQLTWRKPGRLVLKSPTHTFRLPTLHELFPRARYVHVLRDPYAVFASTIHLWTRLQTAQGYHPPTGAGREQQVLDTFCRMHQRLDETRGLIAPERFCDIRYEDLIRAPVAEMRRVYGQLQLGDFESLAPAVEAYFRDRATYQPNRHRVSRAQREAVTRHWLPLVAKYGYRACREAAAGSEQATPGLSQQPDAG